MVAFLFLLVHISFKHSRHMSTDSKDRESHIPTQLVLLLLYRETRGKHFLALTSSLRILVILKMAAI